MNRRRQIRHAMGAASQVLFLRAAIHHNAQSAWEEIVGPRPRRSWLCRLNLRHHWEWRSTGEGGRYQACARCDKERAPSKNDPDVPPVY